MIMPRKIYSLQAKKQRASIVLTISIFILAIIIFSICAIDAGYVVTSRYKTQKLTETAALYMVSVLNSLPVDKRDEDAIKNIKDNFEKLYSSTKISGYQSFKITDIQIKDKLTHPKIKISTETIIPPLFLRYAKIGMIKIRQTSYAKSMEETIPYEPSLSRKKYFTHKAKTPFTDKTGYDLKIEHTGGYFAFAGLMDSNGEIRWAEIGSLSSGAKTEFTLKDKVTGDSFKAYCIEDSNSFDLNSDPTKTIGLVKYLRIYEMDCTGEETPLPDETEGKTTLPDEEDSTAAEKEAEDTGTEDILDETGTDDKETPDADIKTPAGDETGTGEETGETGDEGIDDSPSGTPPVITILNSVKLIKKSEF